MLDHLNRRNFLHASAGLLTLPVIAQLAGCKSNGQAKPEKKSFPDPKFELLDMALQHEFGAVVQYGNHAGIISANNQDEDGFIGGVIKKIIDDEVQHAILLTTILKKHTIEPTVAVWPPQTAETADEMIQKDIVAEDGAIKLYQQILMLEFDDQTKKTIEMIMLSEKEHHRMFSALLPELDTD